MTSKYRVYQKRGTRTKKSILFVVREGNVPIIRTTKTVRQQFLVRGSWKVIMYHFCCTFPVVYQEYVSFFVRELICTKKNSTRNGSYQFFVSGTLRLAYMLFSVHIVRCTENNGTYHMRYSKNTYILAIFWYVYRKFSVHGIVHDIFGTQNVIMKLLKIQIFLNSACTAWISNKHHGRIRGQINWYYAKCR